MPGVLAYNPREGNRAEYLAQYFLSFLGVSVPVIRQEDIGIDFQCSVQKKRVGKIATFGAPFYVQTGKLGGKTFVYGGFNGDAEKKNWRQEGIQWLFAQEIPLFVATVDQKEMIFRLYSTAPLWLARLKYPDPTEIVLVPDATHNPLEEIRRDQIDDKGRGDGFTYEIPLRKPVVELKITDLTDDDSLRLKAAREALEIAAQVDQLNVTYRRLGMNSCFWFTDIEPNKPESLSYTAGGIAPAGVESLRRVLTAAALSFALELERQKNEDAATHLAPLFDLLDSKQIPEWIRQQLPKAIRERLK